jgi:hypothetical protein
LGKGRNSGEEEYVEAYQSMPRQGDREALETRAPEFSQGSDSFKFCDDVFLPFMKALEALGWKSAQASRSFAA